MKKKETEKLYNSITNIEDKYILEAQAAKKEKKFVWLQWGVVAACLCVICISAITIPNIFKSEPVPDNGLIVIPDVVQPPIVDSEQNAEEQEKFVPIASLFFSKRTVTIENEP